MFLCINVWIRFVLYIWFAHVLLSYYYVIGVFCSLCHWYQDQDLQMSWHNTTGLDLDEYQRNKYSPDWQDYKESQFLLKLNFCDPANPSSGYCISDHSCHKNLSRVKTRSYFIVACNTKVKCARVVHTQSFPNRINSMTQFSLFKVYVLAAHHVQYSGALVLFACELLFWLAELGV